MTDSPNALEESRRPIGRALVSVYDKTNLSTWRVRWSRQGGDRFDRVYGRDASRGGSPVTWNRAGHRLPECLDGRVKTLHPKVHAGLLADMRLESHRAQLAELGIEPFDLLISNLYPFTATVASGASPEACVEQIDIGGPAMVRSSAKNHASVAVITSPEQYPQLLQAIAAGGFTLAERQRLAAAAFVHTATYDVAVASWMGNVVSDLSEGTGFPTWMGGTWEKVTGLRYGENPHQPAALYRGTAVTRWLWRTLSSCTARRCPTTTMSTPTLRADPRVTSMNPRWRSSSMPIPAASPSGRTSLRPIGRLTPAIRLGVRGVIAANRPVSVEMARQVSEIFTEVIIAPDYADGALEVLPQKEESTNPAGRAACPRRRREPPHRWRPARPAFRPR